MKNIKFSKATCYNFKQIQVFFLLLLTVFVTFDTTLLLCYVSSFTTISTYQTQQQKYSRFVNNQLKPIVTTTNTKRRQVVVLAETNNKNADESSSSTSNTKNAVTVVCPDCDLCDGSGRIMGGIGAIFPWIPIKAYRPCPNFIERGGTYERSGQGLDEIAFGRDSTFEK